MNEVQHRFAFDHPEQEKAHQPESVAIVDDRRRNRNMKPLYCPRLHLDDGAPTHMVDDQTWSDLTDERLANLMGGRDLSHGNGTIFLQRLTWVMTGSRPR